MGVQSKVDGQAELQVPERQREEAVSVPMLPVVENRLVELAVVLKKLVVVALVPVALAKVKFCKVVEALARSCAVTVTRSEDESPRKVWSWTVKFPAMVVTP